MKKILILIKVVLVFVLIVGTQQSCTKLDEKVYSDLNGDKLFDDPENLIYGLGVAYTNLYQLMGHKYGFIGSEAGTDLLVVPQRGGDWYDGGEWIRYHRHEWTPSETYVGRWWNVLYYGINTCNRLIFTFEALEGVDTAPAIAELRGLRALYYWWLIDIYGNVPIVDKFDVPVDYRPETSSRVVVYDFIEAELLEVMPNLSKETGLEFYGRINYYVAQTVLAKLYLNADVYTGTPQLSKAMVAVDSVISGGYSLSADFFSNFEENATLSTETILGLHFDMVEAPAFEVHLFTLHYNLATKYKFEDNSWNGIAAQETFFHLFDEDTNDVRRNSILFGFQYYDDGTVVEDPSYEKFNPQDPTYRDPDGAPLNLTPALNMLEPKCLRQAGARVAKYPFIIGSDRYTSNDGAIFRLADILLMKAEILLRTGDAGGALEYVNQVRFRANVIPATEVTMETLLDERARELFAEGHRRSDMIRFGVYGDARWEKPEISMPYTTIWPIPQAQIEVNSNLIQNPGY
ncbi:MAG: RagB/SusD family nutrient uptake outer membrane protein [Bacteroidota bacterium]